MFGLGDVFGPGATFPPRDGFGMMPGGGQWGSMMESIVEASISHAMQNGGGGFGPTPPAPHHAPAPTPPPRAPDPPPPPAPIKTEERTEIKIERPTSTTSSFSSSTTSQSVSSTSSTTSSSSFTPPTPSLSGSRSNNLGQSDSPSTGIIVAASIIPALVLILGALCVWLFMRRRSRQRAAALARYQPFDIDPVSQRPASFGASMLGPSTPFPGVRMASANTSTSPSTLTRSALESSVVFDNAYNSSRASTILSRDLGDITSPSADTSFNDRDGVGNELTALRRKVEELEAAIHTHSPPAPGTCPAYIGSDSSTDTEERRQSSSWGGSDDEEDGPPEYLEAVAGSNPPVGVMGHRTMSSMAKI